MPRRSTRSSCCRGPTRSAPRDRTRWSSARAIAARYAADPRVRELASGVLPVAGLLAETGATLRQEQFEWLRTIARLEPDRRDHLLTSVERFRDAERNPLGEDIREDLLARFGLYRAAADGRPLARGRGHDGDRAVQCLARALRDPGAATGPDRGVRRPRASLLKARSALVALRAIAATLGRAGSSGAAGCRRCDRPARGLVGRLALLRLQHLVLAGYLDLDPTPSAGRSLGCAAPAAPRGVGLADGCLARAGASGRAGRRRALAGAWPATR